MVHGQKNGLKDHNVSFRMFFFTTAKDYDVTACGDTFSLILGRKSVQVNA